MVMFTHTQLSYWKNDMMVEIENISHLRPLDLSSMRDVLGYLSCWQRQCHSEKHLHCSRYAVAPSGEVCLLSE